MKNQTRIINKHLFYNCTDVCCFIESLPKTITTLQRERLIKLFACYRPNYETKIRESISNGLMGGDYGKKYKMDIKSSRFLNLVDICKSVSVFEHENRMYLGDSINTIKRYIRDNPNPSDFGVYLQKNCKEVITK